MNWGKAIVLVYITFASFIGYLVYRSLNENIDLVTEDYYGEEIKYQDQIQKMENTSSLENPPEIEETDENVVIKFNTKLDHADALFFNPKDKEKDYTVNNFTGSDSLVVSKSLLAKGLYKVKLNWTSNQIDYYKELTVVL